MSAAASAITEFIDVFALQNARKWPKKPFTRSLSSLAPPPSHAGYTYPPAVCRLPPATAVSWSNRGEVEMSKAPPVEMQPEVRIEDWVIARIGPDCFGHKFFSLVGIPVETDRMRMTTDVKSFDPVERTAVTMSGRTYRLVGEERLAEPHPDTWRMIRQYCFGHGIPHELVDLVPLSELEASVPAPEAPASAWRH